MRKYLFAIALAIITTSASAAQIQQRLPLTGNLKADVQSFNKTVTGSPTTIPNIDQLRDALDKIALPDLQYAAAIAKAKNNAAALSCWTALIDFVQSRQTAVAGLDKPDPALFTSVEDLVDLVNALQPTSPIFVGCAALAEQAKTNVGNMIVGIVGGATSLGALGFGL